MKLSELQAIKVQYEKAIQENGEKLLKEEFKTFFDKAPEVLSVKWRQYTPYFNDGDPCNFNADEFMIKFEEVDEEAEVDEDGFDSKIYGDYGDNYLYAYDFNKDPEYQCDLVKKMSPTVRDRIIKALNTLVKNAYDNDILESVFGDHVQIVATREGFEVEGYEHD